MCGGDRDNEVDGQRGGGETEAGGSGVERGTNVSSLVIPKLAGWKLESEAILSSGLEDSDLKVLLEDGLDSDRASWTES